MLVTAQAVPDLINAFQGYLRAERGRSPLTFERYATAMRAFVEFLKSEFENEPFELENLSKAELVTFLRQKSTSKNGELSRSNWNMRLSALRAFYDYLFKTERIDVNPAARIDRLRIEPTEPAPLSLDEVLRLMEALEKGPRPTRLRNTTLAKILFHCALRVAELASLTLGQVDLGNRLFLYVRVKRGKHLSVSFNDVVAEALDVYLKERRQSGNADRSNSLFVSSRGTRMSVRSIQELVKAYAKKADITRPVTPHLLRHSSVTQLVELGTPLRVVQEMVGHESIKTTQRYASVNSEARRKAGEALARAWKLREGSGSPRRKPEGRPPLKGRV